MKMTRVKCYVPVQGIFEGIWVEATVEKGFALRRFWFKLLGNAGHFFSLLLSLMETHRAILDTDCFYG